MASNSTVKLPQARAWASKPGLILGLTLNTSPIWIDPFLDLTKAWLGYFFLSRLSGAREISEALWAQIELNMVWAQWLKLRHSESLKCSTQASLRFRKLFKRCLARAEKDSILNSPNGKIIQGQISSKEFSLAAKFYSFDQNWEKLEEWFHLKGKTLCCINVKNWLDASKWATLRIFSIRANT